MHQAGAIRPMCMIAFPNFTHAFNKVPHADHLEFIQTHKGFLYGQARATDKGAAEARAERAEAESRELAQRLMEIKEREARPVLCI